MKTEAFSQIKAIAAREVLDSRGNPTVQVQLRLRGGASGAAIVPSGASTGAFEAYELRDGDLARYDGKGVLRAVENVRHVIAPALLGADAADQRTLDQRLIELDGSPRKTRLGANAILGVSLAAAHAGAAARQVPLREHFHDMLAAIAGQAPVGVAADRALTEMAPSPRMPLPMTNMISGGLHAGGNLDFQDVLVTPTGALDYPTGLEWIVRIHRRLGALLEHEGFEGRLVGDEGGYGPRLHDNRQAVEFVVRAIEAAGLRPGADVTLSLDVAATHFFEGGAYRLKTERDQRLSSSQMIDRLEAWVDEFPIASIEDGLAEDDWAGWAELTRRLGHRIRLVGDDLFTTNRERVERGIRERVANAVLVKVNQIGTLTETLETAVHARQAGYSLVVSARSGETEDTTIADLAVGIAAEQIKIGSVTRSERLAKYNRLLEIDEELRLAAGDRWSEADIRKAAVGVKPT